MITVKIDGQNASLPLEGVGSVRELVELVRATIDPDQIIVGLELDGAALKESDWKSPLAVRSGSVLEVTTGKQEDFVADRLAQAPEIVRVIIEKFTSARGAFAAGSLLDGNNALKTGVEDLQAFIEWYGTVLAMMPTGLEREREKFLNQVVEIRKICEDLIQQQLYQSWWAIAETIEKKLEPQLEQLRQICAAVR